MRIGVLFYWFLVALIVSGVWWTGLITEIYGHGAGIWAMSIQLSIMVLSFLVASELDWDIFRLYHYRDEE